MNSSSSSSKQRHSDVCIVGNGAIAKTAALGLAQAGHNVTLLCQGAPPAADAPTSANAGWDVRVYALNPVAQALLASLRVWGALDMARVAPVEAMLVNGDGIEPGAVAFDAYAAHVGALAWIVEDCNLNRALDAALKFAQNVHLVHGSATGMTRLGGNEDANVTVYLNDGSSITAALLVGADGAQSWVRAQCDIGFDYRSYGQHAVVANFACTKPHHGAAHQWFTGADGIVALLPLPNQQVSLVWSAPDALAATMLNETPAQLAARISLLCCEQLGALTPLQPELVRQIPLQLLRPHAVVAPQVALIGDAAHVLHPMAGQGMNLGFADVAALLQVLAAREPQRPIGDARVLERYARARKEDVLLMQFATDALARLFELQFEPLRVVRNLGLNLLDKFPGLKRRLISHAMGTQV